MQKFNILVQMTATNDQFFEQSYLHEGHILYFAS